MTDDEIIAALQSPSKQLVNKALHVMLFEKRSSWVRRVARHLRVDPDAEGFEDAFVEAVYKFTDKVADFDPSKSGLSASITRFTWQKFLPFRRTALRRGTAQSNIFPAAATGPGAGTDAPLPLPNAEVLSADLPDSNLAGLERKRLLDEILSRLGPVCRQTLTLWSLDYSYQEIGEHLKRSNVNSIVQECRERLNRWVSKHPEILEQLRSL